MTSSCIVACRSSLVRSVVNQLGSLDKKVAILYMLRYSDFQVRQELKITIKQLKESKQRIKESLLAKGITENVIY